MADIITNGDILRVENIIGDIGTKNIPYEKYQVATAYKETPWEFNRLGVFLVQNPYTVFLIGPTGTINDKKYI